MIYWPHKPSKEFKTLVRATGTRLVSNVRQALDGAGVSYVMGGRRKDNVTFFVAGLDLDVARKAVKGKRL